MPIARVNDPEGYEITLEEERWDHIIDGHPEIAPLQDILIHAISEPNLIKRDPDRVEVFYYYRLTGRSVLRRNDIYISVVVERSEGNKVGRILTAHLVKHPRKDGEIIWFNLQQKSR